MTAPNIVDVAAIAGESSVKTTLTTSPSTIVFNQVDSNQVYKLNSVVVTNVDGTNAADATVQLARQGVDYSIISTASVPADASLIVVSKETGIYLEEGDAIQAYASANGDLDISVSYETIAETANTLVTRGLVLYLDAADVNSMPNPGPQDHGISDWYCMVSGTATYSAIYPGTIIYEDNAGSVTTVVSETSAPARGTFTTTAGRKYYGNKPIHLLDETGTGGNNLVPLSLMGKYFGSFANRNANGTYYMYSPLGNATVSVYDNVAGGVTGSATTTIAVNQGASNTYSTATLSAPVIFASDYPIVMTVSQDSSGGGDSSIVPPASTNVYRRRAGTQYTINNSAPSTSTTYYVGDTLPSFAVAIADGAGVDMELGLGLENLSDTYSFGNTLSDYQIVAPYASTTVNVSYWNGSAWVLGESHSLSGSLTSPDAVDRDGTNGFGVDGTTISGTAANLGSGATLWKWEGNNPFYLLINDSVDDEETLMGWRSSREARTASNEDTTWSDLSTGANDGTLTNGPTFSSGDSGVIEFDGVNDYVNTGLVANTTFTSSSDFTIDCWFNMVGQGADTVGTLIGGFNFQGYGLYWYESATNILHVVAQMRTATEILSLDYDPISSNTWYHATQVYSSSSNTHVLYLNGSSVRSGNAATDAYNTNLNGYFITIGSDDEAGGVRTESFLDGKISNVKIYNRALSATEVLQNYNAQKARFGL